MIYRWGDGGSFETPMVLDEEEDKEKSPPAPLTRVPVGPMEPPRRHRFRAFGARLENVPDYVYRNLFR